jgi:DNA-binding CsgD family transcriptional regulator
VDTSERNRILSRYADHARRFESVAARRSGHGAEIIPLPARFENGEQTLSPREAQVLQLISEGMMNSEIARVLALSDETIKTHVRHLLAKLAVRSRSHAVAVGFRRGILQ